VRGVSRASRNAGRVRWPVQGDNARPRTGGRSRVVPMRRLRITGIWRPGTARSHYRPFPVYAPQRWVGPRYPRRARGPEKSAHRGSCGAGLKTPRAGRRTFGRTRGDCHPVCFLQAAHRAEGSRRTPASRAPSSEGRECAKLGREKPAARTNIHWEMSGAAGSTLPLVGRVDARSASGWGLVHRECWENQKRPPPRPPSLRSPGDAPHKSLRPGACKRGPGGEGAGEVLEKSARMGTPLVPPPPEREEPAPDAIPGRPEAPRSNSLAA
jgi:hypothetical protein